MTVDELIQPLNGYQPDLRVVVNGYEEGYDDLSPGQLSVTRIALNTGKDRWQGRHGESDGLTGSTADGAEVVEALALRRVSN